MLHLSRREYKAMFDHRLFADRKEAAAAFCRELHACCKRLRGIECDGEFRKTTKREITFLDTRDRTIALNKFVFRQRIDIESKVAEYTLKCRSPDRYVAAGARVTAGKGLKPKAKFEEDIGAPFDVRFSSSNSVRGPSETPESLADASRIFPVLGELERDGERCPASVHVLPVNAQYIFERVLSGPVLRFYKTEAEVALILWQDGPRGRPLVAEFSFRYGHHSEEYCSKAADRALAVFGEIQRMDWCLANSITKTAFAYSACTKHSA
jgi:hypothetical protein